ncbi:MAG: hypothetical protein Q9226_007608 [Calogaya cf. arnoldii]
MPPNPDLLRWVADKQRWYSIYQGYSEIQPIKVSATKISAYGDPSKNEITKYTVPGPGQPEIEFSNRPQGSGFSYTDEQGSINPDQKPLVDPAEEERVARMSLATGDRGGSDLVKTGRTDMVFARVNKAVTAVKLVPQDGAVAAGEAGIALRAAFVILDFVLGEG